MPCLARDGILPWGRVGGGLDEAGARAHDLDADRRLATRIVNSDESAFEELVRQHHRQVGRIVGRFFRRPEVAEEVAQEVFVKAFIGMSGYRGEMPIEHWLSRIAVNACYDQLRKKQQRVELTVSDVTEDAAVFYERLQSPESSADYWERQDVRLYAEQLLSKLSPPERLVLTLMVLEEMSVAEVAGMTGWSVANVKIRAFRARSRLRKLLAQGDVSARDAD